MPRTPRRLASLFLLATSLAGGPGLAGFEAYEHAHRIGPGHGHRIHFERRGGQDHDDRCRAWLVSSPARSPNPPSVALRLPDVAVTSPPSAALSFRYKEPNRLPLSRAPPPLV